MANFVFMNGNKTVDFGNLHLYQWDDTIESKVLGVLLFDVTKGVPYDPAVHAWRIELDLEGLSTHTFAEGPRAGYEFPVAGTVTGLRFYDPAGALLMSATGLKGNVPMIGLLMEYGAFREAWDVLVQGDHLYTGSDNSNGLDTNGDDIYTGRGKDTVYGNGGDDYISDRGGRDSYHGGAGFDTVSYAEWFWNDPAGVLVGLRADLAAGTVRGPDKQTDTLTGIESLRGTHLNDTMAGDAGDNHLMGLAGNDRLDGGAGFDTVRYDRDDRYFGLDGIMVNLASGRIRDGFGFTDRVTNIEAVRGTEQADRMYDDNGNNAFRGNGGADYLSASGGNDTLRGGAGRDQFAFVGHSFGTDVIEDFSKADRDRIRVVEADSMADLTFLQDGTTAVIRLNAASEVRVLNFHIDSFAAADFLF